jgi:hypothetical protein
MPALLTYAGTRLHASGAGLAHVAFAQAETNLTIRRDGEVLRLEGPGGAVWAFTWQREPGSNALRLSGPEGFLSIAADGGVSFAATAQEAGLFLLLSDAQHADLVYVTQHRWALDLPLAKSQPPEKAALRDGFMLRICGCEIPLAEADIAFPRIWRLSPQSPGEIIFQYGDFLAGRARLYNPLIYLCVSGDELVFSMLALFLESLDSFGAYDGQILILADREPVEIARITPAGLRARTNVLKLNFTNAADFATARYRVASHAFADFQPVLYADHTIIATCPVAPLLADLVHQDGICFASEYYDTRKSQPVPEDLLNGFGRPLFNADPHWSGPINCLNTGLIGFTRLAEAERVFPLILAIAARYEARAKEKPRAVEKAAASYVVQKLGSAQWDFLNRYAQVLNHNPPDIAVRHFSLVHFNHNINNARKLSMMRKYAEALRERPATPAQPAGPTAIAGLI